MTREIYVNLPVRDVETTRRFYAGLGFTIDETFSDEACVCVVVAPHILVMAMTRGRFAAFTDREVADAHRTTQVINCISATSREEVDAMVAAAAANGGSQVRAWEPEGDVRTPDGDLMYGRTFTDPDGHVWEVLHVTAAAPV